MTVTDEPLAARRLKTLGATAPEVAHAKRTGMTEAEIVRRLEAGQQLVSTQKPTDAPKESVSSQPSASRRCDACDASLVAEARFCTRCGNRLLDVGEPQVRPSGPTFLPTDSPPSNRDDWAGAGVGEAAASVWKSLGFSALTAWPYLRRGISPTDAAAARDEFTTRRPPRQNLAGAMPGDEDDDLDDLDEADDFDDEDDLSHDLDDDPIAEEQVYGKGRMYGVYRPASDGWDDGFTEMLESGDDSSAYFTTWADGDPEDLEQEENLRTWHAEGSPSADDPW